MPTSTPTTSWFHSTVALEAYSSKKADTISQAANAALARPMTLDYEFNDPSDGESLYTRSDHYSYASKGILGIFVTTGLHPHSTTNTADLATELLSR